MAFREQRDLWMLLAGSATALALRSDLAHEAGGSHMRWLRNHERRQKLRQIWHAWFDDYDALLCPVVLSAAPRHDLDGDPFERTSDVDGAPRSLYEGAYQVQLTGTTSGCAPATKDECKNGGWRNFGTVFKNQGQCVASLDDA